MSQTKRFLEEQASRNLDYGKEFRLKVSHDYRRYVFLAPIGDNFEFGLLHAKELYGFEAYRLVYCGEYIIHLYLKFNSEERAKVAIEAIKTSEEGPKLHVASLSDILEAMYAIESSSQAFPLRTTTIVDTVGVVNYTNPLEKKVVSSMLHRFGDPILYDIQWDGVRVKSVQALFSSLAEALGAVIAFGPWVDDRNPFHNFYYRIRILGGEKEISIFSRQLKIPDAVNMVSGLEYFVGRETVSYAPPQQPQVNEMDPMLLVQQPNNYPVNPPAQRGAYNQRGFQFNSKRRYPRRQAQPRV